MISDKRGVKRHLFMLRNFTAKISYVRYMYITGTSWLTAENWFVLLSVLQIVSYTLYSAVVLGNNVTERTEQTVDAEVSIAVCLSPSLWIYFIQCTFRAVVATAGN